MYEILFQAQRQRCEENMPLKASPEKRKTYKVLNKATTKVYLGLAEFTQVHLYRLPHTDKPGGNVPN